jgi:hypothetical protein
MTSWSRRAHNAPDKFTHALNERQPHQPSALPHFFQSCDHTDRCNLATPFRCQLCLISELPIRRIFSQRISVWHFGHCSHASFTMKRRAIDNSSLSPPPVKRKIESTTTSMLLKIHFDAHANSYQARQWPVSSSPPPRKSPSK